MTFDRRSLKRVALPIPVRITLGSTRVAGTTRDISPQGLCLEIPTPRMTVNLAELLNETVMMGIENASIAGTLKWYTVEESVFQIGICIDRASKSAWKHLIDEYSRQKLAGVVKPA